MADGDERTVGVKMLTGDYKKATRYLAVPITVALAIQQINVIVDTFWVAGLGAGPMAAISIVYPLFAMIMGIGSGLGIGASSAIARSIGRGDRRGAEVKAGQAFLLSALVSVALTPILLVIMSPAVRLLGGEPVHDLCTAYAFPLYLSAFVIILNGIVTGIIRGEGDGKRSMYIQVISAAVNIIADPILIYGLDMGVAGAAWATVIAFASSILVALYWYFVKKDMYLKIRRSDFRYSKKEMKSVLRVGFPEATELSVMNFFNIFLNYMVIVVAGTVGVALYSTSWRIIYLLIIPAQAVGGAMVSVCAAQMGAGRVSDVRKTFGYGIMRSVQILLLLSVLMFVIADPVSSLFTYEEGLAGQRAKLARMIRIFCFFVPPMTLVYIGSSLLQALEKAGIAFVSSLLRNLLLVFLFALMTYTIATPDSLWFILIVGEYIGGAMMLGLALWKLKEYERKENISGTL